MNKYTLVWNDELHSVGIATLDSQHREIINLVNQIVDSVAGNSKRGTMMSLVNDLLRVSQNHFALENQLMVEYGFPDIQSHVETHTELLFQINNLVEDIVGSKQERTEMVSAYLNTWVEKDIIESDMVLGNFLTARGCPSEPGRNSNFIPPI